MGNEFAGRPICEAAAGRQTADTAAEYVHNQ